VIDKPARRLWSSPGVLGTLVVLLVFLSIALSVNVPRTTGGFKGDEATYYSLAHSLARDGDFTFRRQDLARVWEEYGGGPEGIFLKQGRDLDLQRVSGFPFVRIVSSPVPTTRRLYYAKSYIYPLFAAPFVALFGTNGFLVFHALLLALIFAAAFAFLTARGSPPGLAAGVSGVFIFASVVPVYFVWITPELFNLSLVFLAYFLWCYKLALDPARRTAPAGRIQRLLMGRGSDYAAAVLLGIATFSKPTHIPLILPLLLYALWRRELLKTMLLGACFAVMVTALFAVNAATSGEFNYQGGERASFYGRTGFPFANTWETFETAGHQTATDAVPTDIIFHRESVTVLAWNLLYFMAGRSSGLIPYFFPGLVLLALFFAQREARHSWQWLVAAAIPLSALAILAYMPYTYSGGGGPVGNRYYLSFYPLFLFLAPPIRSVLPALVALGIGALFVAKLVINPFYSSFNPGEHLKAGPLRLLPLERTLLNDLPVSAWPERSRRPLDGPEPLAAYFPDDNAFSPESGPFWVKGRSRTEVLLRAPVRQMGDGRTAPLRVRRLDIEITNGPVPNRVTVSSGFRRTSVDLAPGEVQNIEMAPGAGVPYRPSRYPTNYIYTLTLSTAEGVVPFLEAPGENSDSRFLGVRVRIVPVYFNP
jgi:hypothetical protein